MATTTNLDVDRYAAAAYFYAAGVIDTTGEIPRTTCRTLSGKAVEGDDLTASEFSKYARMRSRQYHDGRRTSLPSVPELWSYLRDSTFIVGETGETT